MALSEMNYSGGGSGLTPKTLWTNQSPTSDFSSGTVTLDTGKFSDYDYIKIIFKSEASGNLMSLIWEESEFEKLKLIGTDTASGTQAGMLTMVTSSSGVYRWRSFKYISDTSIQFGNARKSDNTTNYNAYILPQEIIGLK